MYKLILMQPIIVLLFGVFGVLSAPPIPGQPSPSVIFSVFWLIVSIISIVWYRAIIHTIVLTDDGQLLMRSARSETSIDVGNITVIQRTFPNRHIVMQTTGDDYILSYNMGLFEWGYDEIADLIHQIKHLNRHVEVVGVFN